MKEIEPITRTGMMSLKLRSGFIRITVKCFSGLFWALLVLVTLFVHYTLCVDAPEFRYVGF